MVARRGGTLWHERGRQWRPELSGASGKQGEGDRGTGCVCVDRETGGRGRGKLYHSQSSNVVNIVSKPLKNVNYSNKKAPADLPFLLLLYCCRTLSAVASFCPSFKTKFQHVWSV